MVTITAPASGASVNGTIPVSANVSIVGSVVVAGVQFKLDGANLGAEDSTAPYSVSWNTVTASNGLHTLTAVARDALGLRFTSDPVTVTVFNDTSPPAVTITSPASGATVSGTITVSADASDDVGVAGVQFKLDGANLGAEDASAPYSVLWDTTGASDASHRLLAVARDAAGNVSMSAPVTVAVANAPPPDRTPPTAAITAPSSGATVSGTVTVTATASDNVGVAGVQFLVDGTALGAEDTAAPFTISWDTTIAANGSHTLSARARDAAGNTTTSDPVSVTVANAAPADTTPPLVTITSPASGATVSGTITVSADASDDVGVAGVQFKLDGVNLGAEDASAPYEIPWDTSTASNDSHSLTAAARDSAGNVSVSAPVTVTVSNAAPPPATVKRVEETDPSVTYSGVWFQGDTSRPWSGGTTSFARGPGAQASFSFTGTRVAWIGWRGLQAGIARVFIDGALIAEIDLFSTTETVQEAVFTSAVLASGTHSLVIEATGTANPSASDTIVAVDAFDVTTSEPTPPPPSPGTVTRYEETHPSIVYSAGWNPGESTYAWSGGTATYTAAAGAQATFPFSGTGISWIGYRGRYGGIVRVSLDDALVAEIDTYSAIEEASVVVFSATNLAPGSHTLVVELTGRKNPSAINSEMAVDAFDVISSSPPPPAPTRLEETDPLVTYSAGWMQGNTDRPWSGGSAAVSATAGAQATLTFMGPSVRWIGFRGPQTGTARVSLDGVFVAEVDTYAATEDVQAVVFSATDLAGARHTLTIEVTGSKNAASTSAFIAVDAFEVSN